MTFLDKAYTLREESVQSITHYYISFTDSAGNFQDLEVSETLYFEFQQLERKNRNLQQSDQRHKEHNEVYEETLNRRAVFKPKGVEELIMEAELSELLHKMINSLPEIQRRRFLLYYEYDYNYYQIGAMEHCTASSVGKSISIAKEKVKAQMKKYFCD